MLTAMMRQASSTVLPPATVSSAVRSFLMTSSVVCRFRFMGVIGAHAPGLSWVMDRFGGSIPDWFPEMTRGAGFDEVAPQCQ
jgi:hypothetical protein